MRTTSRWRPSGLLGQREACSQFSSETDGCLRSSSTCVDGAVLFRTAFTPPESNKFRAWPWKDSFLTFGCMKKSTKFASHENQNVRVLLLRANGRIRGRRSRRRRRCGRGRRYSGAFCADNARGAHACERNVGWLSESESESPCPNGTWSHWTEGSFANVSPARFCLRALANNRRVSREVDIRASCDLDDRLVN